MTVFNMTTAALFLKPVTWLVFLKLFYLLDSCVLDLCFRGLFLEEKIKKMFENVS